MWVWGDLTCQHATKSIKRENFTTILKRDNDFGQI